MSTSCDECGNTINTCFCEKCRDKYHDDECGSCERVNLDDGDYGYCPDCERGDCNGCERCSTEEHDDQVERGDDYEDYSDYLKRKLCVAGVSYLSFNEFLEDEDSNKAVEAMHTNLEEDDPNEFERRLNETAEKRKAASNFSNE